MNSQNTVVSLQDVEVHFDKESNTLSGFFSEPQTIRAVDGVSLDIKENETLALVGESGCGKTTLGKVAIGLQRPTAGSVKYKGQDIWEAKRGAKDTEIPFEDIRRSLQIIHQDPGSSLNPNRIVQDILSEPFKRWEPKMSEEDRERAILAMLDQVGLSPPTDYANRYPHQLSGGEKQRVALVRALSMNPNLILADEAISALDVSLRVEMMDLMLELQNRFNTTFLFISHDLSNARYLAEHSGGRIGIMYLGKLVEIGTPKQIIKDPQHPYTKVLGWATPSLDEWNSLSEEIPIRDIDIPDPVDPPGGCRFHTRCPEARSVCEKETPGLFKSNEDHEVACFRAQENHAYWESEPLEDVSAD